MVDVIGYSVAFAIGIAIFPVPIITIILLLLTPKAKENSLAFLGGWVGGILLVGTMALLLLNPYENYVANDYPDGTMWFKLLIGLLLIFYGFKIIVTHLLSKNAAKKPKWMESINSFDPKKSFSIGFALSGLNPKNILLIIGGATVIAEANLLIGQQTIVWLVFTFIASLGVATPILIYFIMGDKSEKILQNIQKFMEANSASIMAAIFIIVGVMLISDALAKP